MIVREAMRSTRSFPLKNTKVARGVCLLIGCSSVIPQLMREGRLPPGLSKNKRCSAVCVRILGPLSEPSSP